MTGGGHVAVERLVEYWLGELDDDAVDAIDAHLLGCDACGAELDALIALAGGVRGAFAEGRVTGFVTADFIERLRQRGVRVREYRVAQYGAVNCSVSPEDDLLVGRLQAPLEGVDRVDAELQLSLQDGPLRLEDVPFDARSGEVLLVPKLSEVRQMPAHVLRVRLLAVASGGTREIGRYTLNHRPWS
ncbi:MAG TPA: zf-HC2 domain-containing protein [Caldimonas sp.]|nr:zf-HC2 domain-containing protein [Caldimonas sp.]